MSRYKQIKKELKDFDVSLLHASTDYDMEQMWQELLALVEEVLTPPLRDLVLNLLHRHAEVWQMHPAARQNHHAYLGGLLEHTWFVARLAYQTAGLYPDINRQLVVAGAILHDVGKLKELGQPLCPGIYHSRPAFGSHCPGLGDDPAGSRRNSFSGPALIAAIGAYYYNPPWPAGIRLTGTPQNPGSYGGIFCR